MRDYKAESQTYFDQLAPRYDHHYYGRHGRRQYQRVVAATKGWKFSSVLDVGCGAGGLLALLKRPRLKLAGADIWGCPTSMDRFGLESQATPKRFFSYTIGDT